MQEKRLKVWKRVTALIMSAILVAVSLPLALAAPLSAGTYDPTPTFAEDATLWAWETEEGDVTVSVPEATVNTDYITKHIATYYITLYDLGLYTEVHDDPATENVPSVQVALDATAMTFAAEGTFEVTFTAQEMRNAGITLDGTHRLCVEALAQDSTGWVSEAITTTVSDVPRFDGVDNDYTALAETNTNIREMLMFEAKNNNNESYVSDSGAGGGRLDFIATNNGGLSYLGSKAQAGAEDPDTGVDTSAYGFRVNGTSAQSFNTTWSRQHWIAEGAEEVWFWFDLSQVSVEDLAFELKTQGKRYEEYYWRNWSGISNGIRLLYASKNDDDYSTVTYSTKGYTGDDGYVLIQTADGSWQQVALENGGIDLSNYKGYVRVPIQFICSTTATYVEARNDNFSFGGNGHAGSINKNESAATNSFNQNVLLHDARGSFDKVLVDPAGTPISDALLIQYRQYSVDTNFTGAADVDTDEGEPPSGFFRYPYTNYAGNEYDNLEKPGWGAAMLAAQVEFNENNLLANSNYDTMARVQLNNDGSVYRDAEGNAVILNRETGYKALDDICGAGFSYTSMSADSVDHSFYMDSVMFYKSSGSYPEDMADDPGRPLTDYYDQRIEVRNSILATMEELISSPDLGDYRAVQYIDEMLATIRAGYGSTSLGSAFLSDDELAAAAANIGSDAWNNYIAARDACIAGGTIIQNADGTYTYPSNNGTGYETVAETGELTGLVPALIRQLEKLPDPSTVASVSDTLEAAIIDMWQIYRRLNLTQLEAISRAEEEKIISYLSLASGVVNEELQIGHSMALNAYVPFNSFGTNSAGDEVYRLENDVNASAGASNPISYRFTKGLLGYTTSIYNFHGALAVNDDTSGRDATTDGIDVNALRFAGSDFAITNNGASGSTGLTVTLDNAFAGEFNVVSVSKGSVDTNDASSMYANNMASTGLGDLAAAKAQGSSSSFPLGLVFYVDFSEISNFYMTATISTIVNGTALDFAFNPGADRSWQTFYIMNEATGEWVRVQGNGSASAVVQSNGVTNSAGVDLQLDGYKGYVMLPLWHFKQTINQRDNAMLDESAEALNNIWRVSIGVAPIDSASAQAMDGRSFTIDSIGFGYDSSDSAYGNHGHQTFGEQYGLKTFRSAEFEEAVAALEPQASGNAFNLSFREAVNAAKAQYDALSAYEQNLPSTQNAWAILDRYMTDIANNNTADYAPVMSTSTFRNVWFPNLGLSGTQAVADGNTSGEYDLPYPGVLDTNDDGTADAVNYDAYGLTKELAEEIINAYNTSYSRYTSTQKAELGDVQQQFLNAYNAAMRCVSSLEPALTQSLTFLGSLYTGDTGLYRTMSAIYPNKAATGSLGVAGDGNVYPTDGTYDKTRPYGSWTEDGATVNEGFFISVSSANIQTLETAHANFKQNNDYFAKVLMANGSIRDGAENVSAAVEKLLNNTDTYTDASGQTVNGGVTQLIAKYQGHLSAAQTELTSNGTLSADTREQLLLDNDEYESLIATYHDVAELYDVIQQMYDLTPAATGTLSATDVNLSYDDRDTNGTVASTADPTYQLTTFERYLTDTTGTGTLTITSSNGGVLSDGTGTTLAYTLSYGGTTVSWGAADTDGSTSADVATGITAAMASGSALHVAVPNATATTTTLSDTLTLTFTYRYTDRNNIDRVVTETDQLTVYYTTGDFYTVTVPAEVEIPWGTRTTNYYAETSYNFSGDATLQVDGAATATADAEGNNLTMTNAETTDTISGSIIDLDSTYYGPGAASSIRCYSTVTIEDDEWAGKPLGEYRATDAITYTVTYTEGGTTP